jgi:hypothetical protein
MNYQWVDQILVADGGSLDNTIEIAESMPKTQVRKFEGRTQMKNNIWRNPEGPHLNFLKNWAEDEGADWILSDDCDCFPNYHLKQNTRNLLENTGFDWIYTVRLYLWKNNTHFPDMAMPGAGHKEWAAGLWGWKVDVHPHFETTAMAHTWTPQVNDPQKRLNLLPPYCLLHTTWVDDEALEKNLTFYRESGQSPTIQHPLKYAGRMEELPKWAREYNDKS